MPRYPSTGRSRLRRLYRPFLGLAEHSRCIRDSVAGAFSHAGLHYTLPRFVFTAPAAESTVVRIGVFALIHGDEPAGAFAIEHLLSRLAADPWLASGYEIFCYPLCNPTGYEDGTRENRSGRDLNREFWTGSDQPEVRILEGELLARNFDGIISLHADDTSEGTYGFSHGRALDHALLRPALAAAERELPRDQRRRIDGFDAIDGVIRDCFPGVLSPPPAAGGRTFNVIFETPARAEPERQAAAHLAALESILSSYRRFISFAQHL